MSYSKDELVPPQWINENYLKKILEQNYGDQVNLANYKVSPASPATDHFASLIFRVKLQLEKFESQNETVSLIIKALPTEDGLKKNIVESYDVFDIEISFFSQIAPACHRMLEAIGCSDRLAAKMLYHSSEPVRNIVLQDLKELGYEMSQTNYPSANVYKTMFKKLAVLHATTFKMNADGNSNIEKYKGVCLNMPGLSDIFLYRSGKQLLAEAMETIPGLEFYAEKLKSISNDVLVSRSIEAINKPGTYNVLNHGDLYVKNLMLRNNDKDIDVVFVDFQLCHWGSPAVDIAYIGSFIPLESRDEIIREYFAMFLDILQKLDYNGALPTFTQLQNDLSERKALELYLLILSAPFMNEDAVLADPDRLNIDMFMSDPEFIKRSFKAEPYVDILKRLMPKYYEEGYFEMT